MARPALKVVAPRLKRSAADDWNDYAGTTNYRQFRRDPKKAAYGLWHRWLDERGMSQRTIETYLDGVRSFRTWLVEHDDVGPFEVTAAGFWSTIIC